MSSCPRPACQIRGAALLLQQGQGHGAAVADLARVEAAAPAAVGQLQPVEGLDRGRVERAALDHVAGAGLLQAGQGAGLDGGRGGGYSKGVVWFLCFLDFLRRARPRGRRWPGRRGGRVGPAKGGVKVG